MQLTTFTCPGCGKIYITTIQVRQTISGGRPTLIFPGEECSEEDCGYNFMSIRVESFDIPISRGAQELITKAGR